MIATRNHVVLDWVPPVALSVDCATMGTATTAILVGCSLLLIVLIVGHIGQCHGAPVEEKGDHSRDDARIVRLIHYLSYLIDYLVRTYITDWKLTSPKEASKYFDVALAAGKQDEHKMDGAKSERSEGVVESISKSKK